MIKENGCLSTCNSHLTVSRVGWYIQTQENEIKHTSQVTPVILSEYKVCETKGSKFNDTSMV